VFDSYRKREGFVRRRRIRRYSAIAVVMPTTEVSVQSPVSVGPKSGVHVGYGFSSYEAFKAWRVSVLRQVDPGAMGLG
jgi:hypothetical protein